MNTRIIPCQVNNEYVKGSGVTVGAEGSHNDVVLEIAFSPLWDELTKKITWLDANGGNPTLTILTTNMLKPGETSIYLVPIPAEPKAYAGDLTMTIKGLAVEGVTETRATLTTSCTFKVLPSDYDDNADASADLTPTQAAQLQAEIDTIISTIVNAAASEDAAAGSAASAATSAANAASSETAAETAAATTISSEATASAAATAAGNAKDAAAASAAAAELAKESASTSASTATSAATTATSAATAAEESAATSATSETAAEVAAVTASGAAANAATARDAALVSETSASGSETAAAGSAVLSESWAVGGTDTRPGEDTNNAKYWSDAAQAAAGGGVTSFNSRHGAVAPQTGDYTATMVGADASGTAASAVSTHNGSDGAHATLFAGKSDTSHTHDTRYYTETETDTKLASKADKVVPAATGNFAGLNATGNLADSGNKAADFASATHASTHSNGGADPITPTSIGAATVAAVQTAQTTADSKADKVTSAAAGNLASLDATGNLVDSGKSALDFQPNKNLLKNWFFTDPINTLGQTAYITDGITIDNWTSYLLNVTLTSGGLYLTTRTGTDAQIKQRIVGLDASLTYTFSWIGNGELYSITAIPGSGAWTKTIPNTAYYSLAKWDNDIGVVISLSQGKTMTVTAAKLELGTVSTLARKDVNGNWVEIQPPLQVLQNKANKKIPTTAGTIAALDARGNLLDAGINPAGVYRRIPTPGAVNIKDYVLGLGYSGCGLAETVTTGFPLTSVFWNFIVHYSAAGRIVLEAIQAGAALNRYYCINTDGNWSSWYKLTVTAV